MAIRTPQKTIGRDNFQRLPDDRLLSVSTDHGKDLAQIEVHVGIHGCQIARFASVRIRRMQQDKVHLWISGNDSLQVRWVREQQGDVSVTETGMQLQRLRDATLAFRLCHELQRSQH